jgi:predicted metal-dependent peptidase
MFGELTSEEKLKKAKVQIQIRNPFFAYMSMCIRFHEVEAKDLEHASMGIDARGNLYYCKEFVDKLKDDELVGVLLHETLHLAFLHLLRRGTRDPLMFNFATDIAVNNILVNNGYSLPKGGLIPQYNEIDLGSGCVIKDLEKKNAEQIYDEIEKKVKKISQKMKSLFKMLDEHMEGLEGDEGEGDGKKKKGKGSGLGKRVSLTPAERLALEKDWMQKAQDASSMAKMRGNLPAGMELQLGKLHEAKINWRNILRQQIQNAIPYDQTYCLEPHTLIRVDENKSKEIRKIKVGDTILGYKDGKIVKSKVLDKFKSKVEEKYIIYTKLGKRIVCSKNHRFLLKNGEYIPAKDLNRGDILKSI